MPEWSNGPHSKCGIRVTVSRVRIPVSPQNPPTDRQPAHYQQAVLVIIQVCYWMLSGLSRKFRLSRIVGSVDISWGLQVHLSSLFSYPEYDWRFLCQFCPSQTQSIATVPANVCGKSLHLASVLASTCNRPRKYVRPSLQVRASVLASTCV